MPQKLKVLPMSPVQLLPMSIVYTPFVKGGTDGGGHQESGLFAPHPSPLTPYSLLLTPYSTQAMKAQARPEP